VRAPLDLERYLGEPTRAGLRLVPDPTASVSLASLATIPRSVELLVGPEGGFEEIELGSAVQAGFTPVGLGPRVLRTETAGIVALALLQALGGDLR
jgi:16S rRNA (uracil1498-N3)-methyltransferase